MNGNKEMKKTPLHIILLTTVIIVCACSHKMNYDEFNEYIANQDNGLMIVKIINGVKYKLTYRPAELLIYQHIRGYDSIDDGEISNLKEQYNQYHHMVLSVSYGGREALKGVGNFQQFSSLMQDMAFGMDKYVVLTAGNRDTLQLVDFHFSRYFGMGKSNDIILVFSKEKEPVQSLTFHLDEFGLRTGDTRFRFEKNNLKKINTIKLKY